MPAIRAVTLDFFETLVHHRLGDGGRGRALMSYLVAQGMEPQPWEHQVLYDVLEPHAREYSPDLPPEAKQQYLVRLCRRVLERLGVSIEIHRPADHAARVWELIGPASLQLYPDVHDALRGLRDAGYRLAVVSNWQCGLAHYCADLGIAHYFDHILASAEVGHAKPAPEIFAEAAARLELAAGSILHVGDSVGHDLDGARAAGLQAALLDRNRAVAGVDAVVLPGLAQLVALLAADRITRSPP